MRRWLGFLFAAAIAGCAGGGGGTSAVPSAPGKTAMGTLSVKIIVPTAASAGSNTRLRKAFSAASTTSGILFIVYPHNGNPSTQAIVASGADISSNNTTNCTTSGTTRTCTVSIAAPVGTTNDLLARTYDQPVFTDGTVPSGAHALAAATSPNISVASGAANTVGITLNPVLSTVSLSATPGSIHVLLPVNNISISVLGYDAAGNLILSGSYVDSNGNPVSVSLTTTTNPNNSFTLTASPITGSGQVASATYNGAANTGSGIQVSSSSPYASTLNISLIPPLVYAVSDPLLVGFPSTYQGMMVYEQSASGPDYIYYTNISTNGVSYIEAGTNGGNAGIPQSQSPVAVPTPAGPITGGLVQGNGFIYAGGSSYNTQFSYNVSSPPPPNPQVAVTCSPSGNGSCATIGGLAFNGANGHVYYGSGNYVTDWTPGSTAVALSGTALPGTPVWGGFSYDAASGELWFVDSQTNLANVYMASGSTLHVPATSIGGIPFDVSSDSTTGGAVVTVPTSKRVVVYTGALPGAAVTSYSTLGTPEYVDDEDAAGTWISETSSGGQVILGRIDPTTHVLGEYTLPSLSGGEAGPIRLTYFANVLAIAHYSASGGEILLVVP